jgi:hypothetical protein
MADRGAVIWMSLWFLLLSVGAVWVHSGNLDEDFRLTYWRLSQRDTQDLESLEAGRLASRQDSVAARELEQRFRDYHRTLLTLRSDDQKGQGAAEEHLHVALKTFLETSNPTAFLAEGARLSKEFRRGLLLLEAEIEASQLAPSVWLSSSPDSPALGEIRELSGTFLEHALSSGLLTVDPDSRRDRTWVASTLWLERWLGMVGPTMPDVSMSPLERRLVRAWKVEAAEHLSVERKLQILDEVRQIAPSYPANFVAGALLTRAGRVNDARDVFLHCVQTGEERGRAAVWLKHLPAREDR